MDTVETADNIPRRAYLISVISALCPRQPGDCSISTTSPSPPRALASRTSAFFPFVARGEPIPYGLPYSYSLVLPRSTGLDLFARNHLRALSSCLLVLPHLGAAFPQFPMPHYRWEFYSDRSLAASDLGGLALEHVVTLQD